MKKRIWLGAMTAVMLLATSCQSDKYSEEMESKTSVVSFTLEQPGIASRGYSEGNAVDRLTYAVYKKSGETYTLVGSKVEKEAFSGESKQDQVSITFGEEGIAELGEYTFVFWADVKNNSPYTFNDDGTITVSYDGVKSNVEERDAFFASETLNVTANGIEKTITLTRPFAQLNLGAVGDFVSFIPKQSSVKVKAYNTLNLIDGSVNGEETRTFAAADIPGEVFPVNDVNHYLSMNYLLVGKEKVLLDEAVVFTLYDEDENTQEVTPIPSVPVQRNHRTNIIIEPSFAPVNTVVFVANIDNRYDEPDKTVPDGILLGGQIYETLEDALAVATDGAVITIGKGEYEIPNGGQGKELTFVGSDASKVTFKPRAAVGGQYDNAFESSKITFENLTIEVNPSLDYYGGYGHCEGTYKNCIIKNVYTLYGTSVFENCTFEVTGDRYNVWTWGADATFTGCTFNCDAKAVLVYADDAANNEIIFDNCIFNDSGVLNETKAAIEIGESARGESNYIVRINDCTVNGFSQTKQHDKTCGGDNLGTTLWGNKNLMPSTRLQVWVDGEKVY